MSTASSWISSCGASALISCIAGKSGITKSWSFSALAQRLLARVGRAALAHRLRRNRLEALPVRQRAQLRDLAEEVVQVRGSGARQAEDHDRRFDAFVADLRVLAQQLGEAQPRGEQAEQQLPRHRAAERREVRLALERIRSARAAVRGTTRRRSRRVARAAAPPRAATLVELHDALRERRRDAIRQRATPAASAARRGRRCGSARAPAIAHATKRANASSSGSTSSRGADGSRSTASVTPAAA